MPIFLLPKILQRHANNNVEVKAQGETLEAALTDLIQHYPNLRPYFYTNDDHLGSFVNLYLNGQDVRYLNGMATLVNETDVLKVLFSLAGG